MLFNSVAFLCFFTILLVVAFLSPAKWIKSLLLIASIIFYAFWYPPYLILLLISVYIDYICCIKIEDARSAAKVNVKKLGDNFDPGTSIGKNWMIIAVILNMLILFGFKYMHFAASIFHFTLPDNWRWALPLGISFFTFQTLACTIDVYRGQVDAKRNFLDFLYYICFFPQLIAGPILRLKQDWDHLMEAKKPTLSSLDQGIYLIFWGLIKKMLIADNLAPFVEEAFANPAAIDNSLIAWLGIYAFGVQIYCDFSGYVDSAIGIAKIFGIELPINFNFPYLAKSITEFWHRWHITLSTWLRDYLYIPLGGNRKGRTDINLMLTMLLGGLWHGANWTFVVWGGLHGIYLSIEKFLNKNFGLELTKKTNFISDLIKGLVCFHLANFAWIFFRAQNFSIASDYIQKILDFANFKITELSPSIQQTTAILVIALIGHLINSKQDLKNNIHKWPVVFKMIFLFFTIILIMLFGVKQEVRFIYFDF